MLLRRGGSASSRSRKLWRLFASPARTRAGFGHGPNTSERISCRRSAVPRKISARDPAYDHWWRPGLQPRATEHVTRKPCERYSFCSSVRSCWSAIAADGFAAAEGMSLPSSRYRLRVSLGSRGTALDSGCNLLARHVLASKPYQDVHRQVRSSATAQLGGDFISGLRAVGRASISGPKTKKA